MSELTKGCIELFGLSIYKLRKPKNNNSFDFRPVDEGLKIMQIFRTKAKCELVNFKNVTCQAQLNIRLSIKICLKISVGAKCKCQYLLFRVIHAADWFKWAIHKPC